MDPSSESNPRRKAQAKRIVEYHQNRISDYVQKHATGPGNEKPFRYHLTGGVDSVPIHLRRSQPSNRASSQPVGSATSSRSGVDTSSLISDDLVHRHRGPLSIGGQPVPPPVRLRHPQRSAINSSVSGGSYPASGYAHQVSQSSSISLGASLRQPKSSPRQLPPIVYDGIHDALRGGSLPTSWFNEYTPLHHQANSSEPCQADLSEPQAEMQHGGSTASNASSRDEVDNLQVFEPPMRGRSQYMIHATNAETAKVEWRHCEILSYNHAEQRYTIRWAFGNAVEKRVNALQLILEGECEGDAELRHAEAKKRRDAAEAKLLEQIVIEELSRWEVGTMSSDTVQITSGGSMQRILKNTRPEEYQANQQVLDNLMREVRHCYCQAQARSILFWRRGDLQNVIGNELVQPGALPNTTEEGTTDATSEEASEKNSSSPMCTLHLEVVTDVPFPHRQDRLERRILIGCPERQKRLIKVFHLCGELVCGKQPDIFFIKLKREPYSLSQITRTLSDNQSAFSSIYRTTWPEKITQVFLQPAYTAWCDRTSTLVAKWMEVCIHTMCLRTLHKLVATVRHYAQLSEDIRSQLLSLTYVPPPVYQRTQTCDYERHPLFRIHVCVEYAEADFNAGAELAVEAFFAAADTKTMESLTISQERFIEAASQVRQKYREDAILHPGNPHPDGAFGGGAPTAAYVAIQSGTSAFATSLAHNLSLAGGGDRVGSPDDDGDTSPGGEVIVETVVDPEVSGSILFQHSSLCVRLSSHPKAFQDVLIKHFQKVVELTDSFIGIDSYLQFDGELRHHSLQGLVEVHAEEVTKLETEFEEEASRCFFDASAVVQEVTQYRSLLLRFAGQYEQIRKMLHPLPPPTPADVENTEDEANDVDSDTQIGDEQCADPAGDEDAKYEEGVACSIEELEEHLQMIDSWFTRLKDTPELSERHLGLFVIDATPLRRALLAMCACCRLRLLGCTQRRLEEECMALLKSLQSKHTEIVMYPKLADELQSTLEAVNALDQFLEDKQPQLQRIQAIFQLLHRWSHQVPKHLTNRWYECIHAVPDLRDRAERWRNEFRKNLRGRFNLKIAEHAKNLESQCVDCKKSLDELSSKVSLNKAEYYHSKMKQLQGRMVVIEEQVKKQHLHEDMMDMELTEFPWLKSMIEQVVPLLELWYLAHEWIQWKDEILFGEFIRIDPDSVKVKLASCTETMRRLEDVFASQPRPRQVLHSLSLELTELRVLLPVIVSLRNPGLRDRHWLAIGVAVGREIEIKKISDMSLSVMNDNYPFVTHLSKIQEISDTAAKEMLIEDELQRMQDQWMKLHILIEPIKSSKDNVRTPSEHSENNDYVDEEEDVVYKANFRFVEVWELITEQMAKIKLMAQSPYAAVHEAKLVKHDEKLKLIGELCDLFHETQYGYLQARDHMGDGIIQELLQKELQGSREAPWRRFPDIEKHWQQIMTMLHSQPSWFTLLDVNRILETSRESAAVMDRILKAIHDVLDRRRLHVPLMYRLSDVEFMQVLLRGHDPSMPAVRKCFPGLLALDVSQADPRREKRTIHGLLGISAEYLPLISEIHTDDSGEVGEKLEEWMRQLSQGISLSLKSVLTEVMCEGVRFTADALLSDCSPLQIRCAAVDLMMTTEIEEILGRPETSAAGLQKRCTMCLNVISQIHRTKLTNQGDTEDGEDQAEECDEDGESNFNSSDDFDDSSEEDEEEAEEHVGEMRPLVEEEECEERGSLVQDPADQPEETHESEDCAEVFEDVDETHPDVSLDPQNVTEVSERRTQAIAGVLPGANPKKLARQLKDVGATALIQIMLKWRDVLDILAKERTPSVHSHQWTMVLRHYLECHSTSVSEDGGKDKETLKHLRYTLNHAGFDMQYAWQYLGAMSHHYINPLTCRGVLSLAHAFAMHRGLLMTGPRLGGCREATSGLAEALGIVEERCFLQWDCTHTALMKHVTGAAIAGVWLTVVVDSTTHLQILSVMAQELSTFLEVKRKNLIVVTPTGSAQSKGRKSFKHSRSSLVLAKAKTSSSGNWHDMISMTSYITLQCNSSMLSGQQLPLLLLQTFRPFNVPRPSLQSLCELWLLSSGLAHNYAVRLAKSVMTLWRFSEETGLADWLQHRHVLGHYSEKGMHQTQKKLGHLRVLCDLTVKITSIVATGRRMSVKPSKFVPPPLSAFNADAQMQPAQELEAPAWARASLLCAFRALFEGRWNSNSKDSSVDLQKLLNLTDDDLAPGDAAYKSLDFESNVAEAFQDLCLAYDSRQVCAATQMNSWCRLACMHDSRARGVLVLGHSAVGKSACVDALMRTWELAGEEWQFRRLSTSSLALDAADTLQRPTDAMPRIAPPVRDAGVLESSKANPEHEGDNVLVHIDGELGPSLQGAFLGALMDAPPPGGSIPWPGLYFSSQSWLHTGIGANLQHSMLRLVFEVGTEGARSLGPDLVTRCGLVFLGSGEDEVLKEYKRSTIIDGWLDYIHNSSSPGDTLAHQIDNLCDVVLEPLICLLYGEVTPPSTEDSPQPKIERETSRLTPRDRARSVMQGPKHVSKRHANRHVVDLRMLSNQWNFPNIPRRIALLHVRQAFFALFNSWQVQAETQRMNLSMHEQFSQQRAPRRISNSHLTKEPRLHRPDNEIEGKLARTTSQDPVQVDHADVSENVDESAPKNMKNSREAATAFIFAVAWGLSPLLNKTAQPLLEEALSRLMDLEGPSDVRLPAEYSIFDAVPASNLRHFQHIDWILTPLEKADIDAYVYVPTADARRFLSLATVLSRSQTHMVFMGPPGCGKTVALGAFFSNLPLKGTPPALPASHAIHGAPSKPRGAFGNNAELRFLTVGPWTPIGRWERLLQKPLVNSSRHSLRPVLGVWCMCVVDDCHAGPVTLTESLRFALERGLVHAPGSCAGAPARGSAMRSSSQAAAAASGPKSANRPERDAPAPGIRSLEGVMMLLTARTGTNFASNNSLLRHTWLFTMNKLSESELENIIGDNVSHFVYVSDLPAAISSRKMRYVRFVHSWMLHLQTLKPATALLTPHMLFRFFKSLLCLPTEWLCELSPTKFHSLMLHELIRETVDRLPAGKMQADALRAMAAMQLRIFGNMADGVHPSAGRQSDDGGVFEELHVEENPDDSGRGDTPRLSAMPLDGEAVEKMSLKLGALCFSVLSPAKVDESRQFQRVVEFTNVYNDVTEVFPELKKSICREIVKTWRPHEYVPPLAWQCCPTLDPQFGYGGNFFYDLDDTHGLEPHHAIIYRDFCQHLTRIARLLHHANAKGRYNVWGRAGGKTLICTPCVPAAIALLKAMAYLCRNAFEMPALREGPGLSGENSMSPDELRAWLKEKLLHAVVERTTIIICLTPQVLNRPELLGVLQEALSYDGSPEDWYSEKERRECETALTKLELKRAQIAGAKSVQHAADDDNQFALSMFEQFWNEALCLTHFVLLAETPHQSDRMSASSYFDITTLDAHCPTLLQQLAVFQMEPLSTISLTDVATFYLESPALDLDKWQPDTEHRISSLSPKQIAAVGSGIFNSILFAHEGRPSGYAPRPVPLAPGLAGRSVPTAGPAEAAIPPPLRCRSSWTGTGVDIGMCLRSYLPFGEMANFLCTAQTLCKLKGKEIQERHDILQEAVLFLDLVHDWLLKGDGGDGQARLQEATEAWTNANKVLDEESRIYYEHEARLNTVVEEVIERCGHAARQCEELEAQCSQASKELELSRIQLVNFTNSEKSELKSNCKQHIPTASQGEVERTAIYNLFEICCIELRVSLAPTREEVQKTLADALFNTKLAAVDVDLLSEQHVAALQVRMPPPDQNGQPDRSAFADVKSLQMIANVAFPIYAVASSNQRLPRLKLELEYLSKQREERAAEVEQLETDLRTLENTMMKAQMEEMQKRKALKQAEEWVRGTAERTERAQSFMAAASDERVRWQSELEDLQEKLRCLVPDCLLSASSVLFLGPYTSEHRAQFLAHWSELLSKAKLRHSDSWDLCDYWVPATSRHRWHSAHGLPNDKQLVESVAMAMLQSPTWPLLYDPDGIAGDFFASIFPKATHLYMGMTDFKDKLLAALVDAADAPSQDEDAFARIIIIDNTYLPMLRETDILVELLPRDLMYHGTRVVYLGGEEAIQIKPDLMLLFITKMGEPLAKDPLASKFGLIDFRLSGGDGLPHSFFADFLFEHCSPASFAEWQSLLIERSQLVEDWQKIDGDLAQVLSQGVEKDQLRDEFFYTEDNVNDFSALKSELTKIERKVLKNRDTEAAKLVARSANDSFAAVLCSLSQCCERLRWQCPYTTLSTRALLVILRDVLPQRLEASSNRFKSAEVESMLGEDGDWMVNVRSAVVKELWSRCCSSLPEHAVLSAALHLAICSSIPHQDFQRFIATILLQCPAVDKRVLLSEVPEFSLNGAPNVNRLLRTPESKTLQERRRLLTAKSDSASHGFNWPGAMNSTSKSTPSLPDMQAMGLDLSLLQGTESRTSFMSIATHHEESDLSSAAGQLSALAEEEEAVPDDWSKTASHVKIPFDRAGDDAYTSTSRMFVTNDLWNPKPSQLVFLSRATYFLGLLRVLAHEVSVDDTEGCTSKEKESDWCTVDSKATIDSTFPVSPAAAHTNQAATRAAEEAREAREALAAMPNLFHMTQAQAGEKNAEKLEAYLRSHSHGAQEQPDVSVVVGASGDLSGPRSRARSRSETGDVSRARRHTEASDMTAPDGNFLESSQEGLQFFSFLWSYTSFQNTTPPAKVGIEWTALRGLMDRLEDSLVAHTDKWIKWAESVALGELLSGRTVNQDCEDDETSVIEEEVNTPKKRATGPVDHFALLRSLPEEFLNTLVPHASKGALNLQLVSVLAFVQMLLLLVLLCHSLPTLLAGVEAFVDGFIEKCALSAKTEGLQTVLPESSNVEPIICLCETDASNTNKEILACAEKFPTGPISIKPISITGIVNTGGVNSGSTPACAVASGATSVTQLMELLEYAKDVGHWVVLHFTPNGAYASGSDSNSGIHVDMWDPYELLERCWFFCACLKTEFVDPKFRLILMLDFRSVQYLPRWLFDSRAIVFFDGQTCGQIRPWFEQFVNDLKPMANPGNRSHTLMDALTNVSGQQCERPSLVSLSGHAKVKRVTTSSNNSGGKFKRILGSVFLQHPAKVSEESQDTIASLFKTSRIQSEGKPFPLTESTLLRNPVVNSVKIAGLSTTALRFLMQLLLAVLAASEHCVVGSLSMLMRTPVLGVYHAQVADEAMVKVLSRAQSLGNDFVRTARIEDIFEVVAVLALRQGAQSRGLPSSLASGPAVIGLLQKLQQCWFPKRTAAEIGSLSSVGGRLGLGVVGESNSDFSDIGSNPGSPTGSVNFQLPPSGFPDGSSGRTQSVLGASMMGSSTKTRGVHMAKSIMRQGTEDDGELGRTDRGRNNQKSNLMKALLEAIETHWKLEREIESTTHEGLEREISEFSMSAVESIDEHKQAADAVARAVRSLPLRDCDALLHAAGGDRCAFFLALPFLGQPRTQLTLPVCAAPRSRLGTARSDKSASPRARLSFQEDEDENEQIERIVKSSSPAELEQTNHELDMEKSELLQEKRELEDLAKQKAAKKDVGNTTLPGEAVEQSKKEPLEAVEKNKKDLLSPSSILKAKPRGSAHCEPEDDQDTVVSPIVLGAFERSVAKDQMAESFKAVIDCIEASPLLSRKLETLDDADNDVKKVDSRLQAEWKRQCFAVKVWAEEILEEAKTIHRGITDGFDALGERLLLKFRYWLHSYDMGVPESCVNDLTLGPQWGQSRITNWGKTCPPSVMGVAMGAFAQSVRVLSGWEQPGYPPSRCFGQWLHNVAYRLHEAYACEEVPKQLHVGGLACIKPLLCAMQLDLAARMRVGIERTCLLFEPYYSYVEANSWDKLNEEQPPSHLEVTPQRVEVEVEAESRFHVPIVLQSPATPTSQEEAPRGRRKSKEKSKQNSTSASSQEADATKISKRDLRRSRTDSTSMLQVSKLRRDDSLSRSKSPIPKLSFDDASTGNPENSPKSSRRQTLTRTPKLDLSGVPSNSQGLSPKSDNASGGRKRSTTGSRRGSMWKPKVKTMQKELGVDEVILTNMLADGAVWSTTHGLHVDRTIRGLTRLPALRVRAATPRAAEYLLHQRFPKSHGCLELPLQRVMKSPWLVQGVVNSCIESEELLLVRLPFVWATPAQKWHPVGLFDSLPLHPKDECLSLLPLPESGGGGRGACTEGIASGGHTKDRYSVEGRLHAPFVVSRPFLSHPAAVSGLLGSCSSTTCLPLDDEA